MRSTARSTCPWPVSSSMMKKFALSAMRSRRPRYRVCQNASSQLCTPSLASYCSSAAWSLRPGPSGRWNEATAASVAASSSAVSSGAHQARNRSQVSSSLGSGTRGRRSSLPNVRADSSFSTFILFLGGVGSVLRYWLYIVVRKIDDHATSRAVRLREVELRVEPAVGFHASRIHARGRQPVEDERLLLGGSEPPLLEHAVDPNGFVS